MRSATDRVGQVVAVPGSVPDFCMRPATDCGQVVVAPGSVPDFFACGRLLIAWGKS